MIVRSVDQNHDWNWGKGKNDYKKNVSAVAQNIKTRILSFSGDCFADLEAGIDWFNLLGGKDLNSIRLAVSSVILNTEKVIKIVSVNVTQNSQTRAVSISYSVNTEYGLVNDSVTQEV